MKLVNKFVVIPAQSFMVTFSVDKVGMTPEQLMARRITAIKHLKDKGFKFDLCQGAYTLKDGTTVYEKSYAVEVHHPEEAIALAQFASKWEQESVLITNQVGGCYLVYPQRDKCLNDEYIGQWTEIQEELIGEYEKYTICPSDKNRYFIVK